MPETAEYLKVCEDAAKAAGAVLLDWAGRFQVREKGPADLVTEADLASQALIQRLLLGAFPQHGFVAEEDAAIESGEGGYCWIVDPLDGTTNYVHGLPNYSVSIALEKSGELIVGAVYDPVSQACFSAATGGGAYLNGRRLQVSDVTRLGDALVATSFPARVDRADPSVHGFVEVLVRCQAIRRLGSAALNLCYLSAGWVDAYWATATKSWDVAAGVLIVQEAGGLVTALDGGPFRLDDPRLLATSTREVHDQLFPLLSGAKP